MNKALRLDAQKLLVAATTYSIASAVYDRAREAGRDIDSHRQVDSILLPLLRATDSMEHEERLGRLLIEHAQPIINAVVKRKLRVSLSAADGRAENQDALEISNEIQARLLGALRLLNGDGRQTISNFSSYVAATAHHACHEFLRRKYPRRHSLKNKLRYLVEHHASLSLWESEGATLCGMTAWRFQKKAPLAAPQLRLLLGVGEGGFRLQPPRANLRSLPLQDLVIELFNKADAPVEINALVGVVVDLLDIKEDRSLAAEKDEMHDGECFESIPDKGSNHYLKLEGRLYLERLWAEICRLPSRQRAALLLNLRDPKGNGLIELFPITGVATMRNLAEALEMAADELAELWNQLPLADDAISLRLGATRQQVINLRKSARERLARRMKA
jgi:hypothetical protein